MYQNELLRNYGRENACHLELYKVVRPTGEKLQFQSKNKCNWKTFTEKQDIQQPSCKKHHSISLISLFLEVEK